MPARKGFSRSLSRSLPFVPLPPADMPLVAPVSPPSPTPPPVPSSQGLDLKALALRLSNKLASTTSSPALSAAPSASLAAPSPIRSLAANLNAKLALKPPSEPASPRGDAKAASTLVPARTPSPMPAEQQSLHPLGEFTTGVSLLPGAKLQAQDELRFMRDAESSVAVFSNGSRRPVAHVGYAIAHILAPLLELSKVLQCETTTTKVFFSVPH